MMHPRYGDRRYEEGWDAGFLWGVATGICLLVGVAALTFLAVYQG